MKKIALLATLLCLVALPFAQAQDSETTVLVDNSIHLYPRSGDIGVVIAADPILDYVGNMFNGTAGNSTRDYWKEQKFTVGARYFLFDDLALRAFCRFNPNTYDWDNLDLKRGQAFESNVTHVDDLASKLLDPLSGARGLDRTITYNNFYEVRLGAQMFRGKNRLRGFYGGDILYSFDRQASKTYTYANVFSKDFASSLRTITSLPVATHSFGINAFGGVEFYFYKNMCIGFEAGLMMRAQIQSLQVTVYEGLVNGEYVQEIRETDGDSTNKIHFSTQNPFTGNFYIAFHF